MSAALENQAADGGSNLDPARCPLCHAPNQCQRCTVHPYKGPCWCEKTAFPEELWGQLPPEARDKACVCRSCVLKAWRARPEPVAGPGDSYRDPHTGHLVFTAAYHRRRGYCCGNGCRHCPWIEAPPLPQSFPGLHLATMLVAGSLLCMQSRAAGWWENFAADPQSNGWMTFGSAERFQWNSAAEHLEVNWDTLGPHSFLARPLGTVISSADAFSFEFDLRLSEASGGVREGRPGAMQVAVGLLDWSRATGAPYARGSGKAFDLVEFNWFPEGFIPGFGTVEPTLSAIAFDSAGRVAANFEFPFLFPLGPWRRIAMAYEPDTRAFTLQVLEGSRTETTVVLNLPANFGDFRLDALAILVWDERTSFGDSLQAYGAVDNISVVVPDPPIGALRLLPGARAVEFESQTGWFYRLEASSDLDGWNPAGDAAAGTGGVLRLDDTREAAFPRQFYRVRAERAPASRSTSR